MILENKANFHVKTTDQLSCLHLALRSGKENSDLIQFLVERGAGFFLKSFAFFFFWFKIFFSSFPEINPVTSSGDTPLHYAAYLGYTECAKILLKAGANLEAKGQNQSTSLHFAAREGHFDTVKLLIEAGAALDAKDYENDTPLNCAQVFGHSKIVELIKHHSTSSFPEWKKNFLFFFVP